MFPVLIADLRTLRWRGRVCRVAFRPLRLDKVVKLFSPKQAGKGLALDAPQVVGDGGRRDVPVELVGLVLTLVHDSVKLFFIKHFKVVRLFVCVFESDGDKVSRRDSVALVESVPGRSLCTVVFGVDGFGVIFDNVLVKGILDVIRIVFDVVELFFVCLVVCKQQLGEDVAAAVFIVLLGLVFFVVIDTRGWRAVQVALAEFPVGRLDGIIRDLLQVGNGAVFFIFEAPSPSVSEPDLGNQMEGGRFGATIIGSDAEEEFFVVVVIFCHFNKDVKVAVVGKGIGIGDFVLGLITGAFSVFLDQFLVGILFLSILVEIFHVGMGGEVVEIEVRFFDVFSVVTLMASETVQAFLEEVVFFVPKGKRNAVELVVIGDTGNTVFTPTINS